MWDLDSGRWGGVSQRGGQKDGGEVTCATWNRPIFPSWLSGGHGHWYLTCRRGTEQGQRGPAATAELS